MEVSTSRDKSNQFIKITNIKWRTTNSKLIFTNFNLSNFNLFVVETKTAFFKSGFIWKVISLFFVVIYLKLFLEFRHRGHHRQISANQKIAKSGILLFLLTSSFFNFLISEILEFILQYLSHLHLILNLHQIEKGHFLMLMNGQM